MIFKLNENGKEKEVDLVDVVKCQKCGCILNKCDAFNLKDNLGSKDFYCKEHKLPYERVSYYYGVSTKYKEMLVDKFGEPMGYKKIENKK